VLSKCFIFKIRGQLNERKIHVKLARVHRYLNRFLLLDVSVNVIDELDIL